MTPTIALVSGVWIVIHPKDHLPPHLHAKFAKRGAMISIVTGDVLEGALPREKLRAVNEWLAAHREEVAHVWQDSRAALPGRHDRGMNRGRTYRIKSVEVVRYPVLGVTFDDGLSGEYDFSDLISRGPVFAPLKDEAYFRTVAVGEYGHTFGWNLDDLGNEIDFCPDSTRILIETQKIEELAKRHRRNRPAAE